MVKKEHQSQLNPRGSGSYKKDKEEKQQQQKKKTFVTHVGSQASTNYQI